MLEHEIPAASRIRNCFSMHAHLHFLITRVHELQVVIFNRGRIEQQGTPNSIIKRPKTPFIMKFVGDTNMVPATAQVGALSSRPFSQKTPGNSAVELTGGWTR